MISRPRPAEETERAHGPPEFRAWMKVQHCIGCGSWGCDAAHVHNGGKGRKDDWERTVPLCFARPGRPGCHHDFDNAKESWPAARGLDMDVEAAKNLERWHAHAAQLEALPW